MKQNAEEGCKKHFRYYDAALQFAQNGGNVCPLCGGALTLSGKYVRKFVNQYTALRTCEKHGFFVENIGISKMNEKAGCPPPQKADCRGSGMYMRRKSRRIKKNRLPKGQRRQRFLTVACFSERSKGL